MFDIKDVKIISKYKSVPKGDEKLFLLQEINKLLDEPDTLQERYTAYKNSQDLFKLYKLKDGDIAIQSKGSTFVRFANVKTGKVAYCMMYEILYHLSDEEMGRFNNDFQMLTKILLVKGK